MSDALRIEGLSVTYGGSVAVLDDVNLTVREGEFVAIAGPNGAGKTTLLRTALGLVQPAAGSVELYGEPVASFRHRERLGYLRQRSEVGVEAPVTVYEVVAAGRLARGRRFGPLSGTDKRAIDAAIEQVGLPDRARSRMRELSGGQQQRVFLAKLLAGEPTLLALDEPTTGVDAGSQETFAELLCDLNRRLGVTILYVSHQFSAVARHVDRLVLVNRGIEFDGLPGELSSEWHDPAHAHSHTHTHEDR
ncbi:MAG: metal ABC transporter ATP-binding protein [Thermoleophilia bacterium]|nr:metal ABC transporter ATP-binding protein [Thermoleophilia bacterium]